MWATNEPTTPARLHALSDAVPTLEDFTMMTQTAHTATLTTPCTLSGRIVSARGARRSLALALGVALFLGCGSGSGPTGTDSNTGHSALPSTLVGTWRFEQIGDQNCDPDTGQCTPTIARRETVTLTADGHFEHVMYAESNFPPCSMVIAFQAEGTATAQGSTLTLHAASGRTKKDDNCGEDIDEDERNSTWTYTWEVTAGEGGTPQLFLTNSEGTRIGPYDRQP